MEREEKCCPSVEDCLNPITMLFDSILSVYEIVDPKEGETQAATILNAGLTITHKGKYCCPDCNTKLGYYYLGGLDPFLQLTQFMQQSVPERGAPYIPKKYPCCLNYSLTTKEFVAFSTAFQNLKPPCCDTNFSELVLSLTQYDLTTSSLIEASFFNGKSGLGFILDYLNSHTVDPVIISDVLNTIADLGLVVKCFDCDIFIGTVSAFINFAEAYNINP